MFLIVVVLVLVIIGLIIYNYTIHKKIEKFKNLNKKVSNLSVVQDFMNTIGETLTVEDKIEKINNILIEKYDMKYSTIVVFDGAEYKVRASNVDKKHWDALSSLQEVEMFKESINTATPKYVTVNNNNEKLPYQKMEFGRAKSAMFFPLYIDNVYVGYWIIESGTMHDFDGVDTTALEIMKENIVSMIKTVMYQKTLESLVRKDLYSELYSEEYLYGEGKNIIDKYTISSIVMFKIINLQQINKMYSRELGNKVITEIAKIIKNSLSSEYVFVRYMGPKFVIAFSGVGNDDIVSFLQELKSTIENMKISLTEDEAYRLEVNVGKDGETSPKLNFVITSYYKGTGLEEVLRKEEEFLDEANIYESNITKI